MSTLLALQPEEKMKFDSIFDSLGPVSGILTGDKVKPVLLNSKLPVDILGRVGGPCTRLFFFSPLEEIWITTARTHLMVAAKSLTSASSAPHLVDEG